MSTTPLGSPRTVLTKVPDFFTNSFKQLSPLSTVPLPTSPLPVEPSSTPVSTCMRSTSQTFADLDGEIDLTDEDSDNPDLSPREKPSFDEFNNRAAARVKGTESVRRFGPVTTKETSSKSRFPKEVC